MTLLFGNNDRFREFLSSRISTILPEPLTQLVPPTPGAGPDEPVRTEIVQTNPVNEIPLDGIYEQTWGDTAPSRDAIDYLNEFRVAHSQNFPRYIRNINTVEPKYTIAQSQDSSKKEESLDDIREELGGRIEELEDKVRELETKLEEMYFRVMKTGDYEE